MRAQRVRRRRRVLEGAGIAAAGPVDAAIVDVPDGDAAAPQIVGDPVHDPAVGDLGLPAAAMDHQHGRMRPGAIRRPNVGDLQRRRAVADGRGRLRPRAPEQIGPDHQPVRSVRHWGARLRHRAGG